MKNLIEAWWERAFLTKDRTYCEKYEPRYLDDGFIRLIPEGIPYGKVDTIAGKPPKRLMASRVDSYLNALKAADKPVEDKEEAIDFGWSTVACKVSPCCAGKGTAFAPIIDEANEEFEGPRLPEIHTFNHSLPLPKDRHGETCIKCKRDYPDANKVEGFVCWSCRNGY